MENQISDLFVKVSGNKVRMKNKNLKIKQEDYDYIKLKIEDKLFSINLTIQEAMEKCKESGLNEKASRWYLANGSGLTTFICETLYKYLNDEHIDSALKAITK